MTVLPIVARELRTAARRRKTYLARVAAAFVPIVLAGIFLPVSATQFTNSQGRLLFSFLSALIFGYCLLAGAEATSDCVSGEKREGTVGLLFLTDLRGYDVILGKFVSRSLGAFYQLLGTVPVLALAMLLGGVTLLEVAKTALLLINSLFFSMAAGVFASTFSRNDRRAMFATGCMILLISGLPYLLPRFQGISPVDAFQNLRHLPLSKLLQREFYISLAVVHSLAWILLGIASVALPRVCRERPPGRLRHCWQSVRNRWIFGSRKRRDLLRARLLDRNPYYWLASRDQVKTKYVWVFVAALALLWTWGAWNVRNFIFDWDVSFWTMFCVFLMLKAWVASEVCMRTVETQTNGALELLLTTPLTARQLATGQGLALWRQFGGPVAAVLLITSLLMKSALQSSHYDMPDREVELLFVSLMMVFVADVLALRWVGLWQAAVHRHVNRAVVATCAGVLLIPSAIFIVTFAAYLALQSIRGQASQVGSLWVSGCLWWVATALACDLALGLRARDRFLNRLRSFQAECFGQTSQAVEPVWYRRLRPTARSTPSEATPKAAVGSAKRWLLASPGLVILTALILLIWRRHALQQELEQSLASIQAAGNPVTVGQLRAWLPAAAPEENAALLLDKSIQEFSRALVLPNRRKPALEIKWPGPIEPLSPATVATLSNVMERARPALDRVVAASKLNRSRYPMDWTLTTAAAMPPRVVTWSSLSQIPLAVTALEYEGLLRLESHDAGGVLQALEGLFTVARCAGQEPFLAGQFYRAQALSSALRLMERTLNLERLNDLQLRDLELRLSEAEGASAELLGHSFVGERCLALEDAKPKFGAPARWMLGPVERFLFDAREAWQSWAGTDERLKLNTLQEADRFLGLSRRMQNDLPGAARELQDLAGALQGSRSPARDLTLRTTWSAQVSEIVAVVTSVRTARNALAVERFRVAHEGQPPAALQQLVPEFMPGVPIDPFTGKALTYQLLPSGYLIYSVGPDRQDNRGLERPPVTTRVAAQKEYDLPFRVRLNQASTR